MSSNALSDLCGASLCDLEYTNLICDLTADMHAALSPRERIQQLENACSRASTPLPVLASAPRQSYGRCPITRSPPCVSKTGAVPHQAGGPVVAVERSDTAGLCDAHNSPGKGEINLINLPPRLCRYYIFTIAASIGTSLCVCTMKICLNSLILTLLQHLVFMG